MTHTKVRSGDVEAAAGAMYMLRDPLGCENLGVTVVDADAGWSGPEHDHGDRGHEEVYVLTGGAATVTVEGEDVELTPGDAVRVDPDATRQVHAGDDGGTLVVAGAP